MKDHATVSFRRLAPGEVIGEIIGEDCAVLESKYFGRMTDAKIQRALEGLQSENPDTVILSVELTGN